MSELLGWVCLRVEGRKDSPLTWQVLDWVFLRIRRPRDYATSVTMPMIDKERTERQNRRQREQHDRVGWFTEKTKETPLREKRCIAENDLKIKFEVLCWSLWKLGFMVYRLEYATSEHAVNYIWRGSGNVCMHLENAKVSMTHIHALCPCTCNIVTLAYSSVFMCVWGCTTGPKLG